MQNCEAYVCMCMHMCICMCACVCIYIHTYTCVCLCSYLQSVHIAHEVRRVSHERARQAGKGWRERGRESKEERERDHEGDGLQRRARAASPLPFPSRSGVLRKIARAVSRCKVKPKFCSARRASTAVDSPDIKETALPNRSQTFAAAGPHAPE